MRAAGVFGVVPRLRAALGLDLTFLLALASRVVPAAGTLLTTVLVATRLPKVQQGYFYSFVSLLALQVFVELGLGNVIVQFTAHEFAHLSYDRRSGLSGDSDALSRLQSVARLAVGWFGAGAFALFGILGVVGWALFGPHEDVAWQMPWLVLCAVTAVNLALLPAQFLLEGCNLLRLAYLMRALQGLGLQGGLCIAILAGAGLWANAIGAAFNTVLILSFALGPLRGFYRILLRRPAGPVIRWSAELWPMQWRIAISSISGYLAYSAVTPVAFRLVGPVIAGQLGMSLTLINGMNSIAALPVMLKVPSLGMAIARRDYATLDRIALRATAINWLFWFAGACTLAGGLHVLHHYQYPIASRLLPEGLFWIWLLATAQNPLVTMPIAAYLRAHKREPFATFGVIYAAGTFAAYVLFGSLWGIVGLTFANLISLIVATPVVFGILVRNRRKWQAR